MKSLIIFVLTIFLISISEGDIMSNDKDDKTLVKMSIYLLTGKDGNSLKPGKEGLAFIRVYNQTKNETNIPLFYRYAKGGNRDLKASYLSDEIEFYAGFEIAVFKYYFVNSTGDNIIEDFIICSPDSITLKPKESRVFIIPIKTPKKPGTYKFKMVFDNRNIKKALYSYNLVDKYSTRNLFYNEMFIETLTICENRGE